MGGQTTSHGMDDTTHKLGLWNPNRAEMPGNTRKGPYEVDIYIYTCVPSPCGFHLLRKEGEPSFIIYTCTCTLYDIHNGFLHYRSHLHGGRQCILILIIWRITLSTHTHSQKGMLPTRTCIHIYVQMNPHVLVWSTTFVHSTFLANLFLRSYWHHMTASV